MRELTMFAILIISMYTTVVFGQSTDQCEHCNMTVKDQLHKATALEKGIKLNFDAIECLINYDKKKADNELKEMKVVDYKSGKPIDAKSAIYLKSKAIPSPMGAYLSAFESEDEALKMKSKKGGEVFNWEELVNRFKESDFGALEHNQHNHNRPDSHAPIGVMGDHLHHKGGLMISLRYMEMAMNGNMAGTSEVNDELIYEDYMVAPQYMNMQMFMLGIMYAPSDRLTLMLMQTYISNSMDLTAQMKMGEMQMNKDFSTASNGMGDLGIGALWGLYSDEKKSLHLNSQINFPVGSIQERDDTPMKNDIKLPYSMQLGSGTIDYTLGATFKRIFSRTSIGTQLLGTARSGENSEGYRLGNQIQLNIWGAYTLNSNISLSARIIGMVVGEINGEDEELNPKMIPTANPSNYGGEEIRTLLGFNVSFAESSALRRFRVGAEVGAPFYENYTGIQMNEGLNINCGLKYSIL